MPVLLWFRQDLRLGDNSALAAAIKTGRPVIPFFCWSPDEEGHAAAGAASKWWLHHALEDLDQQLRVRGSQLIIRCGPTVAEVASLVAETGATTIYWNRRYEPAIVARDARLKHEWKVAGLDARSFNSSLLNEPQSLATNAGGAFRVFSPFARAARQRDVEAPVAVPFDAWKNPRSWPASIGVEALALRPRIGWDAGLQQFWTPTRSGLASRLEQLPEILRGYEQGRDAFAADGTSRLSPYLHHGQIGPRQLIGWIRDKCHGSGTDQFIKELYWREFAYHILFNFPKLPDVSLRPEFSRFPWRDDPVALQAWQTGQTGYPVVDAGMRQLWQTGWMHNRARMIVGSFLVKHLLIRWQEGAAWFRDTLVDADLANNTLGWQWVSGCGPDAAPYFRIFNPVLQSSKFDPSGEYIRRYVPELAHLPPKYVHAPWTAPAEVLAQAGVVLGVTYPEPIVDHNHARQRALAAFDSIKRE